MDIEKLLKELSIEEKIKLLSGYDAWHIGGIEDKNIDLITMTDGPHGVRLADQEAGESFKSKPATAFPVEAAMASTWNDDLIKEMGTYIGKECQFYNVGILLGPGINGKRSPLAGRNFEYFSEDPYLTGKIGQNFVKGVQSQGVGTSIKHFVANEQETNRMVISSNVDERTLREIYLKPFEMIIKASNPWTVMCAYNKVNFIHMAHNKEYLIDILRDEWGYDGLVVSDWGAVQDKVKSIKNGLDLEMPGPSNFKKEVLDSLEKGKLKTDDLDKRVRNVLKLISKVKNNKKGINDFDFDKSHRIAKKVAEESIILLKNKDSILPLETNQSLGVIGEFAKNPRFQGGGSSHINPYKLDIPLDEINKFVKTKYAKGYSNVGEDKDLLKEAVKVAKNNKNVLIFVGTTTQIEGEGFDRKDINLPNNQIKLINEICKHNKNVILVNFSGSAVNFNKLSGKVKGILHAWLPGQAGGSALANIIFGKISPSGKLSETFPNYLENNPSYLYFPGNINQVKYNEEIFVGYRYYDKKKINVKYPFGYGLTYTTFEYSNIRASSNEINGKEELEIKFRLKNTGSYSAKEIVQLYISEKDPVVKRPIKELKNYKKIFLAPNESKIISFKICKKDFEFFSKKLNKFAAKSGSFEVLIGSSSSDIKLSKTINLKSKDNLKINLTEDHSVKTFLNDSRTSNLTKSILKQLDIDKENGLYDIVLGMPLKVSIDILKSLDYSKETVNKLRNLI
ncbi:MAG: glycoside hydrolase family 3 C-terminal domain-containing protein [Bacillota bacterium]